MNTDTTISIKTDLQNGLSELLKDLSLSVDGIYFDVDEDKLCTENLIQQNSYNFIDKFFKKPFYNTKIIQAFITKVDIDEISKGVIDLSSPHLHACHYSSEKYNQISQKNQKVLRSLKNPFSENFLSDAFGSKVKMVLNQVNSKSIDASKSILNDFLNYHESLVKEVLLFCEILNLICISQCLYAFCYQLAQNKNFARILEIIILNNDQDNAKYEQAFILIERFYTIYISNISARVYGEETLHLVEQALSYEQESFI